MRVQIESMYDDVTSDFHTIIRTLSLAVGFILLIACVNVAGLTLARGATREAELAIRASIGAGRGRLIRQLLTESVLLALVGAVAGALAAYTTLDSLVALIPLYLPANSAVVVNATVLAFAFGIAVVTALLFGLASAVKLSGAPNSIATMLAVGGRGGAPLSKRAGQGLIAAEVALALVLVAASGLLLRSFAKLVSVDLGFNPASVLTLEVEPLEQSASVRRDYYASLSDVLRQMSEVAAVGAIDQLALTGGGACWSGKCVRRRRSSVSSWPRHRMLLLTLLGAVGLVLTLVGIFSMTAYAVARRTREIGVRIALGARSAQVVAAMIRDAAWPVVLGLAAGLAGTYYATRVIASFLFQTQPHDPATLTAAVAVLGVTALVAAWLPARRAATIDPLVALRAE